ncbi:MAG: ATP-binding cassette domain-containing protein [Clostridiales bacterium]|nr:ATP-binding cassette domain-containing protein [Clostridiales bacterium]
METLVEVQCIKHIYPDKTQVALCGLDFVVHEGERVVVLGPNGAGKTTLLSHILGLLSPVEGSVHVMGLEPGKNFRTIRRNIGVVFQNVDEQIIGPTVFDDIAFTPRNERIKRDETERRVMSVAKMVGIEDILEKIPHYLSGGQKKKVALAGAIVMEPKLLVLDEPFDGLDPVSKREMIELLNRLNREKNITLIITTHDVNLVPYVADIVYVIYDGKIVMRGKPYEVFSEKEILEAANLEPPVLVDLFLYLREKGLDTTVPTTLEQAKKQLDTILQQKYL